MLKLVLIGMATKSTRDIAPRRSSSASNMRSMLKPRYRHGDNQPHDIACASAQPRGEIEILAVCLSLDAEVGAGDKSSPRSLAARQSNRYCEMYELILKSACGNSRRVSRLKLKAIDSAEVARAWQWAE
jgi:hypothetical protein